MTKEINLKNIEGILFDFDGVIADTIYDLSRTWQMAMKDYNVEITMDDYPPLEGMDMNFIAKTLGKKYGREFSDEECKEIKITKDGYYLQHRKFKFFPEIHSIIDNLLSLNKKLCIVTASPREKIEKTTSIEFLRNFQGVVTLEDTRLKKPHPDPYLAGLRKLNLPAEKCLVIENAPYGVTSANRAGIYCVALATTMNKNYLNGADKVFENHKELGNFLFLEK